MELVDWIVWLSHLIMRMHLALLRPSGWSMLVGSAYCLHFCMSQRKAIHRASHSASITLGGASFWRYEWPGMGLGIEPPGRCSLIIDIKTEVLASARATHVSVVLLFLCWCRVERRRQSIGPSWSPHCAEAKVSSLQLIYFISLRSV